LNNDCNGTIHPKAVEGLKLFNQKQFYESHEELEDAWRDEKGHIRELYQGILQIAVAYLHITRGNYEGAVKMYERCMKLLKDWPDVCRGIQVGKLRNDIEDVIKEVHRLGMEGINDFDMSLFKNAEWDERSEDSRDINQVV
jgi:predicted metal-dependent hydrolase